MAAIDIGAASSAFELQQAELPAAGSRRPIVLLGRHPTSAASVATTMLDGIPVSVSGGRHGTVRI